MGVDADHEDEIGNTACATFIDQILGASIMQNADSQGVEDDQIRDIVAISELSSFDWIEGYQNSRQIPTVQEIH